jgi:TolB-like protein
MSPRATAAAPVRHGLDSGAGRLDSWKEIAAYLRRGARTVQRWEREEGMPVRRLHHEKLGSVYAYKRELDKWFARRCKTAPRRIADHDSHSVAVLPFADFSAGGKLRYLCDGLAEEIALALSRLKGLRTGVRPDNATSLLTGSVRDSADRLRIVVRLTESSSGFELWSERFDRIVGDILEFQEELADKVRDALKDRLDLHQRTGPAGPVPVYSESASA